MKNDVLTNLALGWPAATSEVAKNPSLRELGIPNGL
jgi:hypothetical protein